MQADNGYELESMREAGPNIFPSHPVGIFVEGKKLHRPERQEETVPSGPLREHII